MRKSIFMLAMLLFSSFYIVGCGGGGGGDYDSLDSAPVISIDGGVPTADGVYTVVGLDEEFDLLNGVLAVDDIDGDITDKIVVDPESIDTSVVGIYTVVYTVSDLAGNTTTVVRIIEVKEIIDPSIVGTIVGTALKCDTVDGTTSIDAVEYNASQPFKTAVSSPMLDIASRKLLTSHNTITPLSMEMLETNTTGGTVSGDYYHPILMSYLEQRDDEYLDYEPLLGDGSADIGDPNNPDRVMTALSRDNGKTWKRQSVSYTTVVPKSSIEVVWNNETIAYPGDAQKPDMAVNGQHVLVAWNDKYCPSGNPFGLDSVVDNNKTVYADDVFAVNGKQGFIDYEGIVAPNGKIVYQVPFSCVWTARGVIDGTTGDITWYAPRQLTTGVRDSNHITIAASPAGFALVWQEDRLGLKSGKGAGPGEGWSGSTTNRGSDIWYTSIKITDFAKSVTNETDGNVTKPVPEVNFHYPVRITDNEQCQASDSKAYCDYFCSNYGDVNMTQGNESNDTIIRCLTYDTDMLTGTKSILDGDTGASRPALKIVKTNLDEYAVLLGYEETKALTVKITGEGEVDQGELETDIEVEGKSIYFESFNFNAIDSFDESNVSTIGETPMPIVSAGNIINVKVPKEDEPTRYIYENARRLVIGTHIDSCDATTSGDITFAILYKQSFETRGQSSDMFVRTWRGFNYENIAPLNDLNVTNVSAQNETTNLNPAEYAVNWSSDNLDDLTYENKRENTFSPRIFLRGDNIYVGFEYTPYEVFDGEEDPEIESKFPNNFHTNIYRGASGIWTGPKNVTKVTDSSKNTVDARFFTTPKGSDTSNVESDKSNPDVLFVTWGTTLQVPVTYEANITDSEGYPIPIMIEEDFGDDNTTVKEADLFFVRSTDNGETWEEEQNLSSVARTTIQEKEVESFASPDGKHIYNAWLQQSVLEPTPDVAVTGLDSWFGRVDYNISNVTP